MMYNRNPIQDVPPTYTAGGHVVPGQRSNQNLNQQPVVVRQAASRAIPAAVVNTYIPLFMQNAGRGQIPPHVSNGAARPEVREFIGGYYDVDGRRCRVLLQGGRRYYEDLQTGRLIPIPVENVRSRDIQHVITGSGQR